MQLVRLSTPSARARVSAKSGTQNRNQAVNLASQVVKGGLAGRLYQSRLGGWHPAERVDMRPLQGYLDGVGDGNDDQAVGTPEFCAKTAKVLTAIVSKQESPTTSRAATIHFGVWPRNSNPSAVSPLLLPSPRPPLLAFREVGAEADRAVCAHDTCFGGTRVCRHVTDRVRDASESLSGGGTIEVPHA